jgi:putative FmdB family regulatory protein
MPIYEYECASCGCFEHSQSIHDAPLARCPKCRRKVQRLISASSFHLKGGGWYSDGYAGKKAANKDGTAAESKSSDASASESKTSDSKAGESKAPSSAKASPPAGESKAKGKAAARAPASASSE